MLDADTVVFVEVRYRLHADFGGALGSIDGRKQKRLALAATLFLQKESRWANHPAASTLSPCRAATMQAGHFNG